MKIALKVLALVVIAFAQESISTDVSASCLETDTVTSNCDSCCSGSCNKIGNSANFKCADGAVDSTGMRPMPSSAFEVAPAASPATEITSEDASEAEVDVTASKCLDNGAITTRCEYCYSETCGRFDGETRCITGKTKPRPSLMVVMAPVFTVEA